MAVSPDLLADVDQKPVLLFSREEYQGRVDKVRQGMSERGIDVLLVHNPEHIFYLTGYQSFGLRNYNCLILPREGELQLVLRELESHLVAVFSWLNKVRPVADEEDPIQATIDTLRAMGIPASATLACEDSNGSLILTPTAWERIRAGFPDNRWVNGSGLFDAARRIKSPREQEFIKQAAALTDIGMSAALDAIREGATENDLAAAALHAMTASGAEYLSQAPTIAAGWRSGIPHTTYRRRPLKHGDCILIELSGNFNRYQSPLVRTAFVGEAPQRAKDMYAACKEALDACMATIRPGVVAGEVEKVCRELITERGYWENFRKRPGYSVGFSFPPGWTENSVLSLHKGSSTVLDEGMVIHLPIIMREYGEFAVGVSETVIVTADGCHGLSKLSHDLVIR